MTRRDIKWAKAVPGQPDMVQGRLIQTAMGERNDGC